MLREGETIPFFMVLETCRNALGGIAAAAAAGGGGTKRRGREEGAGFILLLLSQIETSYHIPRGMDVVWGSIVGYLWRMRIVMSGLECVVSLWTAARDLVSKLMAR